VDNDYDERGENDGLFGCLFTISGESIWLCIRGITLSSSLVLDCMRPWSSKTNNID
jgi:hypothetical protein